MSSHWTREPGLCLLILGRCHRDLRSGARPPAPSIPASEGLGARLARARLGVDQGFPVGVPRLTAFLRPGGSELA